MISPLRYPGGKSNFTPILNNFIQTNEITTSALYFEPYAGGAGAALSLLKNKKVEAIYLNDLDYAIYSFWYSILKHKNRFIDKILETEVTIDEWYRQKMVYSSPKSQARFDLGFAAFFLNRCNRSGIIKGAGVIGGKSQTGNYKIDARFNKVQLIEKISAIADMRAQIFVSNKDAQHFIVQDIPKRRKQTLIYIDPPYIEQGKKLYLDNYGISGHRRLARYLEGLKKSNWIVSYDDHYLLHQFYGDSECIKLREISNLPKTIRRSEVIFHPSHLRHQLTA